MCGCLSVVSCKSKQSKQSSGQLWCGITAILPSTIPEYGEDALELTEPRPNQRSWNGFSRDFTTIEANYQDTAYQPHRKADALWKSSTAFVNYQDSISVMHDRFQLEVSGERYGGEALGDLYTRRVVCLCSAK